MQRRIVLLLTLAALMVVASVGAPASAQTVNFSPTIGTSGLVSDNQLNGNVSGNDVTVQCVADPLLPAGGGPDQCADDGGSNTGGGLELPGLP